MKDWFLVISTIVASIHPYTYVPATYEHNPDGTITRSQVLTKNQEFEMRALIFKRIAEIDGQLIDLQTQVDLLAKEREELAQEVVYLNAPPQP